MPPFALLDAVSGRTLSQDDVRGKKGTLVMFLCNHCPFVQHVLPELGRLARDYRAKGIGSRRSTRTTSHATRRTARRT